MSITFCRVFGHKWKIVLSGSEPSYRECERCRQRDDGRIVNDEELREEAYRLAPLNRKIELELLRRRLER